MRKIFYQRGKELVLYLIFGGLTSLVSIGTYAAFCAGLHWNELIANIIAWIFAVLFAFVTNRIWVFQAPTENARQFLGQMASFFGGRIITLVIEEMILLIFITILKFDSILVKIIAQIAVIVLNYVISKFWVFKRHSH